MAANSFGTLFRITTFGESHGKAIGVVIDGCPAGLELTDDEINQELAKRAPGKSPFTSPRKEPDIGEIISGVFEGKTTGAPICFIIPNKEYDSTKYEATKELLKPGHANFTYIEKYGLFDYRGGGRASARETACRVAAGAVAKKILALNGITVEASHTLDEALLEELMREGDSIGGVVEFVATGVPAGLGDPVYEKLEANLAAAMMSLPATKGFELGSGFRAAAMKGSSHNDAFIMQDGKVQTATNNAGGTLAGITTGMPIVGRVAFKPAASIKKPVETVSLAKESTTFVLPEGSRHDPCVAIRAVPVVEAMAALVLVDALLMNRCCRL